MCGIVGGLWCSPILVNKSKIEKSLSLLNHRGPDDRGYEIYLDAVGPAVVMGHTRLSILDLTSRGHQPMTSDDERFHIVFNGEVYNYKELRVELKELGVSFQTDTDTEVLLYAWIQWGRECLTKLEGMFSFVIYDVENSKLYCVRDAFGIKPFYYYLDEKQFVFSSELLPLTNLIDKKLDIDRQRCYDYLVHADYDSSGRSFIKDVSHLRPAHMLEIDLSNMKKAMPIRWWYPSIAKRSDLSFEQATDLVRDNFLTSVAMHLRSDVPIGAALSGGIDSSAIVCAMRYLEPELNIKTFSYIASDKELSEEKWVDFVTQQTGAECKKIFADSAELASDLEQMIVAQGEPFSSTSIYAQYRVFRAARESGVVVTLDGQGADELHAGYLGYPGQRMKSLLESFSFLKAYKFYKGWLAYPGRNKKEILLYTIQCCTPLWLNNVARYFTGRKSIPNWIEPDSLKSSGVNFKEPIYSARSVRFGRSVVDQLRNSISNRGLVGLLRHADRNSMAFSLESRVPFLTIKQAELLFSLPEEYLISEGGQSKNILRAALRGIVPDEILDRRDKIGFTTPEANWLKEQSVIIDKWLKESDFPDFLNRDKVNVEFNNFLCGKNNNWKQVWRWVNFLKWYNIIYLKRIK